jgi:hypothetical protein
MTLVRIVKNWDWPDIMRQTPGSDGVWDGVRFTLEPVAECDYLIVLNRPAQDITVRCPPQHVWAVVQEPPNECFQPMHRGDISYGGGGTVILIRPFHGMSTGTTIFCLGVRYRKRRQACLGSPVTSPCFKDTGIDSLFLKESVMIWNLICLERVSRLLKTSGMGWPPTGIPLW